MRPAAVMTRIFRSCPGMAAMAVLLLTQPMGLAAQNPQARPLPDRVRGPVTASYSRLQGQTHPMVRSAVDLGALPNSTSTGRMVLWLRRSADQQAKLTQFLSETQNPASANYRKWLTPATYGAAYGISDKDLNAVQQWLRGSGLQVDKVSAGRNAIQFSGTVAALSSAFHTSIHTYAIGQQRHVSNASDPQVPTALAGVIAGLSPMNDFRPKPMHVNARRAHFDAAAGHLKADITVTDQGGNQDLFVTPADASVLYDTPNQNFNAAATKTYDGTGVTIGILGYSALVMPDVQNYRSAFLPSAAAGNLPKQILDGGIDPGVINGGDASESLLDVEIAGGLAPGAAVNYYYSTSTDLSDGLILAGLRALEENKVSILSASYGECEADLGPGGNLGWSELWQQAAAQGISVTVSTGDSGSASCDGDLGPGITTATRGLSVSGLASTPYNIAVGGTDFYPLAQHFSDYVDTTSTGTYPYYGTALKPIPENPWNDSSHVLGNSFTQNQPAHDNVGDTDIIGGGGGLSSVAVCTGTIDDQGNCSDNVVGYPQPPFQSGVIAQSVRALPDVSLLAANGFYNVAWVICSDSVTDGASGVYTDCKLDANGHLVDAQAVGAIGGTSASAPAFAGMLALISQSQGGARLGQANNVLYNLATDYSADPSHPGKYQRAFHDVTIGNNSVYCTSGSQDCGSNSFLNGYNATPSYDMASGLGSVDLSQLISLWSSTGFASTTNTLSAGTSAATLSTAAIRVTHGTPLYFSTAVTGSNVTGQFSLVATNSKTASSSADFGSLGANGVGQLVTNDLPGGTYTVQSYYAGDASHSASESSNSIPVDITAEQSTTKLFFGGYDPTTFLIQDGVTTLPYGSGTFVSAQPYGNASTTDANGNVIADGVPTGNVTFTVKGSTQTASLNSIGVAQISATSLTPGAYTYQASYPGDASFAASTSAAQTLTITKGITSFLVNPSSTTVTPTGDAYLAVLLQTDSLAAYPVGNISASVHGHTYSPSYSTQGVENGTQAIEFDFIVPAYDLAPGSNTVTFAYSGDSNYLPSNAGATVTLTGASGSFSLSGPTAPVTVEASQQTSTTISITPSNGFTGLVSFACSVSAAPSGHAPICQTAPATVYAPGAITTAVSIASFADTPAGMYTLTINGTSGQQTGTVTVPLQVTAGPSFTVSAAANSLNIAAAGQQTTDVLTLTSTRGFAGNVVLSCAVAPLPGSGKAPACTVPGSLALGATPTTATLQVTSDSTTPPGAYSVSVTAVSGSLQQTLVLPLTIPLPPATPAFSVSAAQTTLAVAGAGQTSTDTLTITPAGGFTGVVQMSCTVSGSAANIPTCSVPASTTVTGSSAVTATLTVNTAAATSAMLRDDGGLMGERIGGIAIGCLLLGVFPRRRVVSLLGVLVMALGILGMTGCGSSSGGGSSSSPGTPAGSYTVAVKAVSGSITTTTQVVVTVQ